MASQHFAYRTFSDAGPSTPPATPPSTPPRPRRRSTSRALSATPIPHRPSIERLNSLPQYGFGPDTTFEKLVESNPFLFRVYSRHAKSPEHEREDPFFLGAKFDLDESTNLSDVDLRGSNGASDPNAASSAASATYADAIRHLDWTKRSESPYISTSFSFAWAVWEASRRYQDGVKHDIQIAVIDARAVMGRAITALELLRQGSPAERHRDHWKFYRFASEAQDVLVFGCIPSTAILSSIPLLSLLPKLPAYFLREETSEPDPNDFTSPVCKPSPFSRLAWSHDQYTKPSYKQFCQTMSDRFLALDEPTRLQAITAGSARLAISLLRPWFHRTLLKADAEEVAESTSALALVIAQWPAQWWARDRAELDGLVRGMIVVVAEEVKETRRVQALREVERLQEVVRGLERQTREHERRAEEGRAAQEEERLDRARERAEDKARVAAAVAAAASAVASPPSYDAQRPQWPSKTNTDQKGAPEARTRLGTTASALVSGLLFGSFCMLSIISSQSWELANHLT